MNKDDLTAAFIAAQTPEEAARMMALHTLANPSEKPPGVLEGVSQDVVRFFMGSLHGKCIEVSENLKEQLQMPAHHEVRRADTPVDPDTLEKLDVYNLVRLDCGAGEVYLVYVSGFRTTPGELVKYLLEDYCRRRDADKRAKAEASAVIDRAALSPTDPRLGGDKKADAVFGNPIMPFFTPSQQVFPAKEETSEDIFTASENVKKAFRDCIPEGTLTGEDLAIIEGKWDRKVEELRNGTFDPAKARVDRLMDKLRNAKTRRAAGALAGAGIGAALGDKLAARTFQHTLSTFDDSADKLDHADQVLVTVKAGMEGIRVELPPHGNMAKCSDIFLERQKTGWMVWAHDGSGDVADSIWLPDSNEGREAEQVSPKGLPPRLAKFMSVDPSMEALVGFAAELEEAYAAASDAFYLLSAKVEGNQQADKELRTKVTETLKAASKLADSQLNAMRKL